MTTDGTTRAELVVGSLMTSLRMALGTLACTLALSSPAAAQDYQPDVLEMPDGLGYFFDWDPAYDMAGGGTIEFWTMPFFEEAPGYEPFIVSSAGELGASYAVAMTEARDGLVLLAGDEEGVIGYDFTVGRPHHVAINIYEDGTVVYVNGEPRADFDFVVPALPATALFLGTANGEDAGYQGMIAQLRFWGTPVDPDYLDEFKLKPPLSPEGDHPDVEFLRAMSDFSAESIDIIEAVTPR
ncbi:LamG-like jellyroll fold domain-containing protein [Tateyamaria sp. SN3-11]|uniref:LamG-like jellyroll fold domain-containing protein n=1 Tax=Tateyamaria sp. SN3-11 TaxID=3092147 RepID=UPI0039EBC13D